jgi:Holliday junction resolvase
MGRRKRGGGGKRDEIEPEVVKALRDRGCRVWHLSGQGCPDLLVYRGGKFYLMEVKTGTRGRLTKNQQDLIWPVVRSIEQALNAVGLEWL